MSLYAEYLRSISSDHIIENEHGFATYRFLNDGKTVYIVDLFVVPEKRRSGVAFDLCNQVVAEAKRHGCTELLGTVLAAGKHSTVSVKFQFAFGLSIHSVSGDGIILRKDI